MRRVSRLLPTALLVLAQLIGPGGRAEEVAGTGQRCGVDWDEANGKCGTQCPHDSSEECPAGEDCFSELDDGGGCALAPPPPPPSTGNPVCWSGEFTAARCCDVTNSPAGDVSCWPGSFDFAFCCPAGGQPKCPVTELVAAADQVGRECCGPAGSTYECPASRLASPMPAPPFCCTLLSPHQAFQ